MNLEGQTALVTGGSRGIGRAICVKFASMGANVVINFAGNEQAALETEALCKAYGHGVLVIKADISKETDWMEMVKKITEQFESIDILVNNAGITRDKLMMAMKEEDFDCVVETNLKGTFLGMKTVSKLMMKKRYGRIINMSSVVGLRGNAGQVNYAATKAGVIGMTKSIAKELASRNITVNAIAPGMIATEMTAVLPEQVKMEMEKSIPAGRMGTPEEVAEAVAVFATREAAYLTGQVLCVDGGMAV